MFSKIFLANPAPFCLFSSFSHSNYNCLGFEPGAAGLKVQTKPRSNGGLFLENDSFIVALSQVGRLFTLA